MSDFSHPVRVAIIGVSGYGSIHLQLTREARERGEIRLTAATIINPEEETETIAELRAHGTEIFDDYRAMFASHRGKLDLCLIPTGIHWHSRMTIAALEAGANVLVEKPLAGSSEEVAAIRAAEARSGRFVAVGFQDYYEAGASWLKAEIDRGVIGTPTAVRFLGVWPRPRSYFTRNDWAGRLQVGGVAVMDSPLNNAFAHFVMLGLYFAGEEAFALERAELLRAHAVESFDTAVVRFHTERGVRLWFGVSHACTEVIEPEIVITGSRGRAGWRYEKEAWWSADDDRSSRRDLADITGARREMFRCVLARLRDPSVRICTSELASRHTALVEGLHRGAEIVTVPPGQISWVGVNGAGSQVPDIQGLGPALRLAYLTGRSLAESNFSITG